MYDLANSELNNLNDDIQLNRNGGVHPDIVGMAIDYLTHFENGSDLRNAFSISIKGACNIR